MRVLLDCDGVIADFPTEVVRWCNIYGKSYYGQPDFELSDVNQHDILKAFGIKELQPRLDQHLIDTDFCRTMPVYEGAHEFVRQLQAVAHVVIVTSPNYAVPNWEHAREEWLRVEFGIDRRDIIFARNKSLVIANYLVDDQVNNCNEYSSNGIGEAICIDRPWNQEFQGKRANTYAEVLELFE